MMPLTGTRVPTVALAQRLKRVSGSKTACSSLETALDQAHFLLRQL